eukprot:CAMPEP_0202958454 /NCGR_PEP_ID=MMETSP1396-20130829/2796_1 /ASSEMBLY_ACC=CAM_ASM_000872 /TAXON_ID= /ORGANISM="Pseudokeronopsis sp., Strain Brazil" /LENGTH=47 /DNA_ID= /DNA_START= /DNA_END= /DNA_ORIENTATION=
MASAEFKPKKKTEAANGNQTSNSFASSTFQSLSSNYQQQPTNVAFQS